jgi:hypothetical protein
MLTAVSISGERAVRRSGLVICLCVAFASCSQQPPQPPTPPQDPVARLNEASTALAREERKLESLSVDYNLNELAAATYIFRQSLPAGATTEGLNNFDPREGGNVYFADDGEHNDKEKANLKKIQELVDKFAAALKDPASETASRVAAHMASWEDTRKFLRQKDLVEKLRRERDEAQAAIK